MAQTSNTQMANPISVVGSNFLAPSTLDLVIVKKVLSLSDGSFTVTDVKGNVMFKVKGEFLSFNDRRLLLDAIGNPIISFHKKLLSFHNRWVVYKGDSLDPEDIIFSTKRASSFQLKTLLDVFLANNEKETVCDFKIKGSWFDRSCTIYAEDGTTVIAQMHKELTLESVALGKDTFCVTVYPNVDYAFIVALVVILHEIK